MSFSRENHNLKTTKYQFFNKFLNTFCAETKVVSAQKLEKI